MWETNNNLLAQADAIVKIKAMGTEAGYATYKVYYDGKVIATPSDLPESVDMTLVSIGQMADQA